VILGILGTTLCASSVGLETRGRGMAAGNKRCDGTFLMVSGSALIHAHIIYSPMIYCSAH
jgi:hypothetical protein